MIYERQWIVEHMEEANNTLTFHILGKTKKYGIILKQHGSLHCENGSFSICDSVGGQRNMMELNDLTGVSVCRGSTAQLHICWGVCKISVGAPLYSSNNSISNSRRKV